MVEGDVGFPTKVARQTYEYLQQCVEEQKKQIAEQTAELRSIYDTVSCGIIRLMRKGGVYHLLTFNRTLEDILGTDVYKRQGQTILMVTHSVKAASHAGRVLFLRDGVVFHQLYRGGAAEHEFYQRILDAMNALSSPEPQGEFAGMEVSYHA